MNDEQSVVPLGLSGSLRERVSREMAADRVGSGDVPVLATPVIVTLVEQAAVRALEGRLPEESTSVGSMIRVAHVAPTPVGSTVEVTVRVDAVDSRRVTFSFRVSDDAGEVATGTHDRVVVDRERFMDTAVGRAR